jgi:hypothetical protein
MKFDDVILGVIFQVKKVELEDGTMTYCMWVSRDPEDAPEYGKSFTNLTLASSAHVLMRLYPIDKSVICLQSERRTSC